MSDQNQENSTTLKIDQEQRELYKRLDQFITASSPDLSRTIVKSLFVKKLITCSDPDIKLELKKMPARDCTLTITVPVPKECSIEAEDLPLDILFEDSHLIVINKAAGMVTHPAPGHYSGTLVNAILHHCKDLTGVGDELRPGIVHRLDKGTSGVMVVAKTAKCHQGLIDLFSKHDITRQYVALTISNKLAVGGTIDSPIGRHPQHRIKMAANVREGKPAKTFYHILKSYGLCHYVQCKLETGRTHQIRVHLSQCLSAPILNDSLYGKAQDQLNKMGEPFTTLVKDYPHPFLHARTLGFVHPITKEELQFDQAVPTLFQKVLDALDEANTK